MKLLAHQGFWKVPQERNSAAAFERAFVAGYGVELDVRDDRGALIVSHDPPTGGELPFEAVLDMHAALAPEAPLAINIKSDGLAPAIKALLADRPLADGFVFDMSASEALHYRSAKVRFFTRFSEHEREPRLYAEAAGVWLDAFESDFWWAPDRIEGFLADGKAVAIASPELHGRGHDAAWSFWRDFQYSVSGADLTLCTDAPDQAEAYFV